MSLTAAQVLGTPTPHTALALVRTLAVKGRAPMTGYRREAFGAAWTDTNRNGCDTRNDILKRDLADEVFKTGTRNCVVLSGDLSDPYTGKRIHFVRGGVDEVEIDHVVALGDAWRKGAQGWAFGKRLAFANDPLNLLAVDSAANQQKRAADTATWLPPNRSYRCTYVARQVAVKAKYQVSVTVAERDAMTRVLSACPAQVAPSGGDPTMAPVRGTASPTGSPGRRGTDPRFATCKEAKAAGYGPYYRGKDPEYGWYRDSDNDGVVCE